MNKIFVSKFIDIFSDENNIMDFALQGKQQIFSLDQRCKLGNRELFLCSVKLMVKLY